MKAHATPTSADEKSEPVDAPIVQPPAPQQISSIGMENQDTRNKVAALAVVAVGAALIEVELVPAVLVGAAAIVFPGLLPKMMKGLRPLIKSTVRAGYSVADRAREGMAEMSEHFQDVVAEVKAEQHAPAAVVAPKPE